MAFEQLYLLCRPFAHTNREFKPSRTLNQIGKLGVSMKASTASRLTGVREGTGLICIYTKDWTDIEDVRRVLGGLRALGISDCLYYKADALTLLFMSGSVYCSRETTGLELIPKGREWYRETGTTSSA
jgi:hypothetical protein